MLSGHELFGRRMLELLRLLKLLGQVALQFQRLLQLPISFDLNLTGDAEGAVFSPPVMR
jgi:hypothetical protein